MHAAVRLLPCLASGVVTIVVAQLYKTDLAKGWAAWLQVLVTIGVGWGALLVFICCLEQVTPSCRNMHPCFMCPWRYMYSPCMARTKMLSADMSGK